MLKTELYIIFSQILLLILKTIILGKCFFFCFIAIFIFPRRCAYLFIVIRFLLQNTIYDQNDFIPYVVIRVYFTNFMDFILFLRIGIDLGTSNFHKSLKKITIFIINCLPKSESKIA